MAARHRSDILETIVRQHACANGDAFILMQDNATVHTAQVSMTFIDDTRYQCDELASQVSRPQPNRTYLGHFF